MSRKTKSIAACAIFTALACSLCACSSNANLSDIMPHQISVAETEPVRPIDTREQASLSAFSGELTDEQYRNRVDELYSIVVEDGKKPVFAQDDPVKPVYDAAIAVLNRYILNAWQTHDTAEEKEDDDYLIVHSLHDYLVYNITYDMELYESYATGNIEVSGNPAFGIDGVFLNKVAVCDGISRAMNFLCAIEGVESIRVTGTLGSIPHAWNKVKVGDNWYNLDATADMCNYYVNGKAYKQLAHGYFLLSDETYISFRMMPHSFSGSQYGQPTEAFHDYDIFTARAIEVDGSAYAQVVTSQRELNALFKAVSNAKQYRAIEVKLNFPGKSNVNDSNMYRDEIVEAYSQLKNPSFEVSATNTPYFQMPNGVYLFLLYQ